jgi:diguanylate cyclase (GGDEF)-like protein/PAS domain S-box-containing protein
VDADAALRRRFTFHIVSPIDRLSRTGALHRGERYPILTVVTRSDDGILQPWLSVALWRTVFRVGLALLFFVLGLVIVRQITRRQTASNALLRREREFRVLAEGSGDAVLRMDLAGIIDYASPAARQVTGLDPEALLGRSLVSLCVPAENATVAAALRDAISGLTTRASFFTAGEGGQRRRISATLHASGEEDDRSLVGVLRDDTDGYNMERRLMSLATTDALTGLANRHVFAEQYDREWRRAVREGSALALLFVDADRFKEFNDHYGHPQGDACLRNIAHVIAKIVRRPGDLSVRYGGEEFLLLLPNTDSAGAERVAEQLRVEIEMLAIPHANNDGFGVMTVSVGIAVTRPGAGRWFQQTLLDMADQALYAAKTGGRNCIRASCDDLDPTDIEFRTVDPTAH